MIRTSKMNKTHVNLLDNRADSKKSKSEMNRNHNLTKNSTNDINVPGINFKKIMVHIYAKFTSV